MPIDRESESEPIGHVDRAAPMIRYFASSTHSPPSKRSERQVTTGTRQEDTPEPRRSVIPWLLDSDPSIRWQVMRDLLGESDEIVAGERSRVASEGWGARLLDLQASDGQWGGGTWLPRCWISTSDTLLL